MTKRRKAGPEAASAAELEALIQEIMRGFYDLRATGQKLGVVPDRASGPWGLLRSLAEDGPTTMCDLARKRSVSRQYIHKIARMPIRESWITLEPNPADRRAPLMAITPAGEERLRAHQEHVDRALRTMCEHFVAEDVAKAAATVAMVRRLLEAAQSSGEDEGLEG